MEVTTFYDRINILLHNYGDAFVTPNPFWKQDDIKRKAQAALEVVFTTLIEKSKQTGVPVQCLNRAIKTATATAGTNTPADFYDGIIGYKANGDYVLYEDIPIGAALAYDRCYSAGGKFYGTADFAYYYASPVLKGAGIMDDFPDGFYDTVITLTAIETVMGEAQDAADRIDVLYELFQDQLESLP